MMNVLLIEYNLALKRKGKREPVEATNASTFSTFTAKYYDYEY